jgi:hypothetical protein
MVTGWFYFEFLVLAGIFCAAFFEKGQAPKEEIS